MGYGDGRDPNNRNDPRGESFAESLAEVPEHIAWALWIDKCRYVTIEAEIQHPQP